MKEIKGLYCRVPTQMFSGTLLNFLGELLLIIDYQRQNNQSICSCPEVTIIQNPII